MAFQPRKDILYKTLFCSLLTVLITSHHADAVESDILCLRSIKDSLEDPHHYLSSWNFNKQTEAFICSFSGVECWHPDENRVLNLKLSNMGLMGQFPRGLQNCSSLTGLDLSFNDLTGPIPFDISTLLRYVTTIDLSNNKFSGEIPKSLANCTYLNSLKLDNNMLTGQIPKDFGNLQRLKTISFGNNCLSGSVPVINNIVPVSGFNKIEIPTNISNNEFCPLPNEFNQSFKHGLIVGSVSSLISFVAYMCYYCAPCARQGNTKKNHQNKANQLGRYISYVTRLKVQRIANYMRELLNAKLVEKANKEISVLLEGLNSTWKLEDLHDATNCFNMDNAIGMGRMGIMYQGALPNGQYLAIKRLFGSQLFKRQFLSEIKILSEYKHMNVIPLLGFCTERTEKILVYQYMPNGRLSKWLHPLESEVMRLKWPERIHIAVGIARGLSWLHHRCNLRIVHLNICSECILLDENFEPKYPISERPN